MKTQYKTLFILIVLLAIGLSGCTVKNTVKETPADTMMHGPIPQDSVRSTAEYWCIWTDSDNSMTYPAWHDKTGNVTVMYA
jgi:hypothetical protein